MNKQTLIDDYKQTIERLQKECTEKTDCLINLCEMLNKYDNRVKKLEEKLSAQFTEMEEKLIAEEMKNYQLNEENKKLKDMFIIAIANNTEYVINTNKN